MADASRLERTVGLTTAGRLADAALVALLVAAVAACWVAGLSAVAIGVLVVGSVGLEHAVSRVTRRRILASALADGTEPTDRLRTLTVDLATEMGLPAPEVVVEESGAAGITVLQGGDGPVVLLSRPLLSDLDEEALRGVIAHELAHLERGHISRFDGRDAVAHVVGASAFWLVIGQQLPPLLSLLGLGLYVLAGVFRGSVVPQLCYLGASLGVVVLPLGLIAFAHRLQERQADDTAVAVTTPEAFCRGLVRVATTNPAASLPADLIGTAPPRERRGLIARLTATHPPLSQRLARYGVALDDVVEE